MAYVTFDNNARKHVKPADAIRLQLAIKYPERASQALLDYAAHVTDIAFTPEPDVVQGRLPYKENREL